MPSGNGNRREPRHARVVVFPTQPIILPNPQECMRKFFPDRTIGIPSALRLCTSGVFTCPYYDVPYQLKNRAETTEGKVFLPALPRGSVSAQAIEASCHARSRDIHLRVTTLLSTTRLFECAIDKWCLCVAHPRDTVLPEQRPQPVDYRLSRT